MINRKSSQFWVLVAACPVAIGAALFLLRQRETVEADIWESVHAQTPHEHGTHGQGTPERVAESKPAAETAADARRRLSELSRAIEADPANKRFIIERINLAIAVDPPLAIRECQKILRDTPESHFALQHIASAYLEAGDLDKALHYAVLASQRVETVDTRNTIAQVFYRRGLFDKAMLHYEQSLKMDPNNEHARAAVAMIKAARDKAR